jgi:hypothetical protein
MQTTYVGFNQDHHGITQLGRIVLDGCVFGFIRKPKTAPAGNSAACNC